MKKIVLVVLASLALFSCGDDDSGGSALKPATVSVGGTVITYSYDSKNRIQSLSSDGMTTIFTYNAKGKTDRLTTGAEFFQFSYDSNNKLVSINDEEGITLPVTVSGNSYNIDGTVIQLTPSGDVSNFLTLAFAYDSGKGAFANVKSLDLIALVFANSEAYLYTSKKRLQSITSAGTPYPYVYTEAEKGLPATATVDGTVISYTYSN